MTAERAEAKAARLAGSGRVTVRQVERDLVEATVRGDSARVYSVAWTPDGWTCMCDARTRCSHIRAVMLVTLEPARLPALADTRRTTR